MSRSWKVIYIIIAHFYALGAFAIIIKSTHYANELIAARKGSPLLIGVKTEKKLKVDFVDVEFGPTAENSCMRILFA